jgi:hypothetical protein
LSCSDRAIRRVAHRSDAPLSRNRCGRPETAGPQVHAEPASQGAAYGRPKANAHRPVWEDSQRSPDATGSLSMLTERGTPKRVGERDARHSPIDLRRACALAGLADPYAWPRPMVARSSVPEADARLASLKGVRDRSADSPCKKQDERRMPNMVDAIGFLASALVLLAFVMQDMVLLRLVALLSNIAFLAYGGLAGLLPVMMLHATLLPLNLLRLLQLRPLGPGLRRDIADRVHRYRTLIPLNGPDPTPNRRGRTSTGCKPGGRPSEHGTRAGNRL